MSNPTEQLRTIPKVDDVLAHAHIAAALERTPRAVVVDAIRDTLEALRRAILEGTFTGSPTLDAVAERVLLTLDETGRASLRRVINATGVVLHTNLGRAPLCDEAVDAVEQAARGYSVLEYDAETGERSSRYVHVEPLLTKLTGAEAAMAVNNNAGAVLLTLAALTAGGEVIVSRGELVEIGGKFRVPDIMALSGGVLREIGTTNKTHASDYEQAITENTAAILKVHQSNFKITGFTQDVDLPALRTIADRAGVPLIYDQGCGALIDYSRYGLPHEPTVAQSIESGADIVCFSGDKLLGGPQAGLIVGKKALIDKIKQHPYTRALRIDKLTLAALEATLRLYLDEDAAREHIPTLAMLTATPQQLRAKADRLAALLDGVRGADIAVIDDCGQVGGGSMPDAVLSTPVVAVTPHGGGEGELLRRLRACDPPIIGRVQHERLILDVRTVDDSDLMHIAKSVKTLLETL